MDPTREPADWDAARYLRYADHRLRPAVDLLRNVNLAAPRDIVDLGCGAGNVTRLLAERWPDAQITGVDSSPTMLARAREEAVDVRWVEADIAAWAPAEPPDLIFANASLHWLPHHEDLLPRLIGHLREGGCLAVQMPRSWGLPSHRLMRETLADGDGGRPLGTEVLRASLARPPVAAAPAYHAMLADCVAGLDIWETESLHELTGEDPVLRWVETTGLRPVLDGLSEDQLAVFLPEYRRRLRAAYPVGPDGRTLYPFRRLFLVARR